MRRAYAYFAALVGLICVAFVLAMLFLMMSRIGRKFDQMIE